MDKTLRKVSIAFVMLGLLVSIYMTIFKLTDNSSMCLGNGGCSVVNASRYSLFAGIPVAAIGILGYASLLTLHLNEARNAFLRENASLLFFGLALAGFVFTVYLVYVEVTLIKALCPFCLTSQVSMTVIFSIAVFRLLKQPQPEEDF